MDLTGMDFTFDSATGAYHARIFGLSTEPLNSGIWLDFVLVNLDRAAAQAGSELIMGGTILPNQTGPNLTFELSGTRPELTMWRAGDRVAPGQNEAPPVLGPLPPDGRSGNTRARKLSQFGISFWYIDDLGIDQSAAIQVVPEPSALVLTGVGLGAFAIYRRLQSRARARQVTDLLKSFRP